MNWTGITASIGRRAFSHSILGGRIQQETTARASLRRTRDERRIGHVVFERHESFAHFQARPPEACAPRATAVTRPPSAIKTLTVAVPTPALPPMSTAVFPR